MSGETRCARCRAVHDDASWNALPLVQRLYAGDTSELMTSWPWNGASTIEARRCRCDAIVSRARRA
ncbi:MAG: hypothetical protein U0270_03985 [Labilithrix sp.]